MAAPMPSHSASSPCPAGLPAIAAVAPVRFRTRPARIERLIGEVSIALTGNPRVPSSRDENTGTKRNQKKNSCPRSTTAMYSAFAMPYSDVNRARPSIPYSMPLTRKAAYLLPCRRPRASSSPAAYITMFSPNTAAATAARPGSRRAVRNVRNSTPGSSTCTISHLS